MEIMDTMERIKTTSTYFYYKSILRKVSFDTALFQKELNKGLSVLSKNEGLRLYRWALTFSRAYPELHFNMQAVY
ncbi:MAG: Uncharacterised protein [Flavobacteriaceae bacterium]|nr:MAG: Uncharacterised protein [Flavobacteriaceae bacterium]